ncbi:hypothetical protein GPALN_013371 [Globodera pallida]|nr:hypothetical protein GPALN_013371 [Globodera pallida]
MICFLPRCGTRQRRSTSRRLCPSLNERTHALTQRGVAGNMAGLQQCQEVMVEGLVVSTIWYVDHNYILPPYSPFFTRYEWKSAGAAAVFRGG